MILWCYWQLCCKFINLVATVIKKIHNYAFLFAFADYKSWSAISLWSSMGNLDHQYFTPSQLQRRNRYSKTSNKKMLQRNNQMFSYLNVAVPGQTLYIQSSHIEKYSKTFYMFAQVISYLPIKNLPSSITLFSYESEKHRIAEWLVKIQ